MAWTFEDTPEKPLSFQDTSPVPTERAAAQRIVKTDYALGDETPGPSALSQAIMSGGEGQLRRDVAASEALKAEQTRMSLMLSLGRQGQMQPEEIETVRTMSTMDLQTDPQTVFEKKFAERFSKDTLQTNSDNSQSVFNKFGYFDPPTATSDVDMYTGTLQSNEYEKNQLENLHGEWQKTSWMSALPQYAGQVVPLLSAYRLSNVLKGAPTTSILPGDNIGQQVSYLKALPPKERKVAYDAALTELKSKNMLTAMEFAQAVVSFNATDSFLSNAIGVADASGVAGTLGRGLVKIGGKLVRQSVPLVTDIAETQGPKLPGLIDYTMDTIKTLPGEAQGPKLPGVVDYTMSAIQEMQREAGVRQAAKKTYYIPEAAAKKLEAVEVSEGKIVKYVTKTGEKTRDDSTVFIDPTDEAKLSPQGESRLVTFGDGSLARSVKQPDGQWSLPFDSGRVYVSDTPKEGLVPMTLGGMKKVPGSVLYHEVKFDGAVTGVTRGGPEPVFYTDVKNKVSVAHAAEGGEGMVPVDVFPDKAVEFRPTIKGTTYYIPEQAAKNFDGLKVSDGKPTFYTDLKNGVSVDHTLKPEPGLVPVEVSADGNHVKFLPTVQQEADDFRVALKDSARAVADTDLDPVKVASTMGDVPKASKLDAAIQLNKTVQGGATELQDIIDGLPSAYNPSNFFGKGKAFSREYTARITDKLKRDNEFLMGILGKVHVPRGTEEAIAAGVRETENRFRTEYGGRMNDAIIDFVHVPPELNPNKTNLDTVVMRAGMPNGLPFESRAMAEQYMKDIYQINGEVQQQGASFYITTQKYVDETSQVYREALLTKDNTTPVNLTNMVLNRLRSADDILSPIQNSNRKVATHAPQVLTKALREQAESTSLVLTKKERDEVMQTLIANRDDTNPATGVRGLFYTSDADFENAFLNKIGHLPTQEQTAHYFNHTRLSDFDWVIKNIALHRDKGRLGVEQFTWKGFDKVSGDVKDLPWVEGKALETVPWGGQDAGIWIQEAGAPGRLVYKHSLVDGKDALTKAEVEKLYKEKGYRVFQILEPAKRPLKDTLETNEQIHFVISNSLDQKALGWDQVPYRPGGHSIYRYDHYVKQGQFEIGQGGRLHYYGDNSLMNFSSEAEAAKYADRLEQARIMLKNNDPNLDAFLAKNIPYTRQQLTEMVGKGHLSLEHPVVAVRSGTTSLDVEKVKRAYPDFVDATKSEYNLGAMIDRSFLADRDEVLDTVRETGKTFQLAKAEQLDPYSALNRGLGQAVRNLWMADQKISAVQHFMEEFGTVMDPKFKTVTNSPMHFLYHPQWNERADKATLAAAKASRLSIINFMGAQSEIAGSVSHLQNKLISSIYNKFGQDAADMVADHALPMIKDPAKYVRAVAFHSKLGFFNPIQLVVQAQSLAHVLAVAGPKNGLPGAAAGFIARRMLHNDAPEVMDKMANIASSFGWKPEDFKQMVSALKSSGIGEISGETIMRDDLMDPKLYNSTVGRWLEKGTMFFNEGERSVRLAAFATSFREWKLGNPLAELTNREMAKVMQRSDLLSVNMTRASSASWQNGLMSIPTQFMAFNARLAEQFLGGRLTTAEKARAFGTYATLYGIPTATAGAVGVWPFYDDIKMAAQAKGIDLSPAYMKALMEGIPHLMISATTGHDYNISQRLGPNGAGIFRDAMTGEKNVMELLGGPSSSIIGDIWNSTDPVRRAITGAFTGNSEAFPVKATDLTGALSTISTLGLGQRVYGAVQYGKYISRNNVVVGEMDGVDAAFAMLGLTPSHIADAQLMSKVMKNDKSMQKPFETKALENYRLALGAAEAGDDVGFRDYMTRVTAYMKLGDFNAEDKQRILSQALKHNPTREDKIRWDFIKNSPDSQYSSRFNSFFINKGQ